MSVVVAQFQDIDIIYSKQACEEVFVTKSHLGICVANKTLYVVKEGNVVCGYAIVSDYSTNNPIIFCIEIFRDFRKKGFGTLLVSGLIKDYPNLHIGTMVSTSVPFWRKMKRIHKLL